VFKLVPMLNPDGVIVGNYRTSLSAVDLNRVYKSPRVDLFPTIHYTKSMIKEFMKERKVCKFYCSTSM
jgi:murein tripeptide amidase MpaA